MCHRNDRKTEMEQKVKGNRCMRNAPNRRWETVIEIEQEFVWHLNLLNLRILNVTGPLEIV